MSHFGNINFFFSRITVQHGIKSLILNESWTYVTNSLFFIKNHFLKFLLFVEYWSVYWKGNWNFLKWKFTLFPTKIIIFIFYQRNSSKFWCGGCCWEGRGKTEKCMSIKNAYNFVLETDIYFYLTRRQTISYIF